MNELNLLRQNEEINISNKVEFSEYSDANYTAEQFISEGTRQVNRYIYDAIDTLSELRKQGTTLEHIRDKMLVGLKRIGVSDGVVDQIKRRYSSDYVLFVIGCCAVIFFFISFRFIFKFFGKN